VAQLSIIKSVIDSEKLLYILSVFQKLLLLFPNLPVLLFHKAQVFRLLLLLAVDALGRLLVEGAVLLQVD
jgi:hypothetical protein